MPFHRHIVFGAALIAVLLTAAAPLPSPKSRADAIIAALSLGDPATYEAAARANFSPEFLAARTPAARADFVANFHRNFGTLKTLSSEAAPDSLKITVHGEKGPTGVLTFGIEPSPLHLITRIQLMVEAGGDGERAPKIPPPPVTGQMPANEMSAALERWLAPYVQHEEFSGVLLIAKDGKPFVSSAHGLADREHRIAANDSTSYNIASIGKKFAQTAIASLIQAGRLKLTTTIADVLPDYPDAAARSATITQLITMQGGISDFFVPEFEKEPKSRFDSNHAYYGFVSHLPQRFAPGTRTEYCNGCYVVLGEIVERLSGQRFEDYVEAHVLKPAGMTRAGYFHSGRLPPDTARPYMRSNGPGSALTDATGEHGVTGSGAGGVYA